MRFIYLLPIAISLSLLLLPADAQEPSTTDHRPQDSRLQPLTDNSPKCLTEVRGIPILKRLVSCLVKESPADI